MGQHEDAVYLAKLAEQAERYEGPCLLFVSPHATRRAARN